MTTELLQGLVHGLPRFARNDIWLSLALHRVKWPSLAMTAKRALRTLTAKLPRCVMTPKHPSLRGAKRQSMDQFVPHVDNGLER
jgi:hypothetical protein